MTDRAPLVTREALAAFTQRLVEGFAPEKVILFGSLARGEGRWDSDADILVVMPFEGQSRDTVKAMLDSCQPEFPLDLHLRRPAELAPRYRWGDPFIREALDHGERLHGTDGPRLSGTSGNSAGPATPTRNPVVEEWIERAERHWRMAILLPELPPGYLSGLFQVQRCLETYLRAAMIALGIPSRKERDLLRLSDRLGTAIPGWDPDPHSLNILTLAAAAYLDPGVGDPEPGLDGAWAIAQAAPLRDGLRHWFDSLEIEPPAALVQEVPDSVTAPDQGPPPGSRGPR
ncbi:MAG: nucleotidyltransferase domain-containing protein [Cyanobacteriota bacterium]|nr:nucleotidyltransferase domain-containing protein [Cyanobacteriota bacterium]